VNGSSLPVLTSVATEVRIRKKSEARKKRSAGSAGRFAGSVAEAAMGAKFHGSTQMASKAASYCYIRRKDNASRAGGEYR
jgi:hypothetical protein